MYAINDNSNRSVTLFIDASGTSSAIGISKQTLCRRLKEYPCIYGQPFTMDKSSSSFDPDPSTFLVPEWKLPENNLFCGSIPLDLYEPATSRIPMR